MEWLEAVLAIDIFISLEMTGIMLVLFSAEKKVYFPMWATAWLFVALGHLMNLLSGAGANDDWLSYVFMMAYAVLFYASSGLYGGNRFSWGAVGLISGLAVSIPALASLVGGQADLARSFNIAIAILLWVSATNFLTSHTLERILGILLAVLLAGAGALYLVREPVLLMRGGRTLWHAIHVLGNGGFSLTLVAGYVLRIKAESVEFKDKYQKAFRSNHAVMLLINPETGGIEEANAAASEFYGYTEARLCSMRLDDISQTSGINLLELVAGEANVEGQVLRCRHLLRDGRVRDVEMVAGPLKTGNAVYLLAIIRDMTDQVQNERLHAVERQLLLLGNQVSEERGFLYDAVGVIGGLDLLNCCCLYVYAENEPGVVMEICSAVADRETDELLRSRELIDRFVTLTQQGGCYATGDTSVNIHAFRKLAARGILSVCAEPIINGNVIIGMLLVGSPWRNGLKGRVGDVLESMSFSIGFTLRRLRSDAGRKQSEGRWRFALEGVGDMVVEISSDLKVRYLNENMHPLLGFGPDDAPQLVKDWEPYIHPEDMQEVRKVYSDQFGGRSRSFAIEHRLLTRNADWRWFLQRGIVISQDGEASVTVLAILSDIHPTKMYESELVAAKSELERANNVKSLFLANISHELRTPMNGINGMIQLLGITDLDPDQAESLEIMRESSSRMMGLIDNLITYTGLEGGAMTLQRQPFDFDEMITGVMTEYRDILSHKELEMKVDLSPMLPKRVIGDGDKIRLILRQWMDNALKFTDSGTVGISLKPDLPRTGAQKDLHVVLSVSDTGIGISEEVLPRLFQDFSQADNSYTRAYQGAGLGLAICRRLRDMLGAEFEVDSRPGEGSVFRMKFKVERMMNGASSTDAAALEGRVLVVDDDEVSRRLLGLFCEKLDLEVQYASGGAEAIRLNDEQPFDMIFMDIQMPEISGLEATRIIRERNAGRESQPRIVAVTAYAFRDDKERFLAEGMDDFMSKPIDSGNLFALVKKWIGKRQA